MNIRTCLSSKRDIFDIYEEINLNRYNYRYVYSANYILCLLAVIVKKKETKTRIIVNNRCNHCIEKMETNPDKGVSGESLTTKVDDDESLNNISFGVFKAWLENNLIFYSSLY